MQWFLSVVDYMFVTGWGTLNVNVTVRVHVSVARAKQLGVGTRRQSPLWEASLASNRYSRNHLNVSEPTLCNMYAHYGKHVYYLPNAFQNIHHTLALPCQSVI